jgi:hypothetical protein
MEKECMIFILIILGWWTLGTVSYLLDTYHYYKYLTAHNLIVGFFAGVGGLVVALVAIPDLIGRIAENSQMKNKIIFDRRNNNK